MRSRTAGVHTEGRRINAKEQPSLLLVEGSNGELCGLPGGSRAVQVAARLAGTVSRASMAWKMFANPFKAVSGNSNNSLILQESLPGADCSFSGVLCKPWMFLNKNFLF